jgi:hypothetical protein
VNSFVAFCAGPDCLAFYCCLQSLAINGVTVDRVRNSSLANTAYVLIEAAGLGPRPGSAVLSDFTFTPLPWENGRAGVKRRRDLVSAANPIDALPRIVGRQVGLIPGV